MKRTKIVAAALAVATVATIGTASAASAAGPSRAAVIGSASGKLDWLGFEGDAVRFDFAAQGVPGNSSGRFHVNHERAAGGLLGDFEGRVDCVMSVGDLAVVTGVIERADTPGAPPEMNLVGRRIGVSVQDNPRGHDRIGWSWGYGGFGADVLPCTGPVPFFETTQGGYVVR